MRAEQSQKYLINLIGILVTKLGGRVEISDVELADMAGRELRSYEDIAKKAIVLEVRDPHTLRYQTSPQRPAYGGNCVATPLQPEQHDGDYAYYEIVEDNLPQLPEPSDQTQETSRNQPGDQPST